MTTNLQPIPTDKPIDQATIVQRLIRLFEHCEQHDLDLHLLFTEASFAHTGEPDVEESG